MSTRVLGPPMPQIGDYGCPHVSGYGQELLTPTLASYAQVAAVPITVFELQRDDLMSAQTQARREQQHGAIAQPGPRAEVATIDRTLRMLRRYRLGQCRRGGPSGHGGHCSRERSGQLTAILRVAQERSQGVHDTLQRRRMQAPCLTLNEGDPVVRTQRAQIDRAVAEMLIKKLTGNRRIALNRYGRQPLLILKMLLKTRYQLLSRCGLDTNGRAHTLIAQELQQLRHSAPLDTPGLRSNTLLPTTSTVPVTLQVPLTEISQPYTPLCEPTVKCHRMQCFDINDTRRVLLRNQRSDKNNQMGFKRTGDAFDERRGALIGSFHSVLLAGGRARRGESLCPVIYASLHGKSRRMIRTGHSPAREIVQLLMAEQHLDGTDIFLLLKQVRGKSVAQRVHGHPLVNVRSHGGLVHGAVQLPGTHGLHWIEPRK